MLTEFFSLTCEEFGGLLFSFLAKPKQKQGGAPFSEVELVLSKMTKDSCFFVSSLSIFKHAEIIAHIMKFTFIYFVLDIWGWNGLPSFSCLQSCCIAHPSKKKNQTHFKVYILLKKIVFTMFL